VSSDTVYLLIVLAIIILASLIIYFKDLQTSRRISRYEITIDDLNKRVFSLEKLVKQLQKEAINKETISREIDKQIQNSNKDLAKSLLEAANTIKDSFKRFAEDVNQKVEELEGRVRDFSPVGSSDLSIDEDRVISMYNDGHTVDEIARTLRAGRGQVEFILKISNIIN